MAQKYTFFAKVDRTELNAALRQIDFWDGKARLRVENAVSSGTKRTGSDAKRRTPRRTGSLRRSIKTSFKKKSCTGLVMATWPTAHLLENGVSASTARPKTKKAMKIYGNGLLRYATKARIPRRSARPFMKPAYDANVGKIISDIKKAVRS